MTIYTKDHCPEQLLQVIVAINENYYLDTSPVFEEGNGEFTKDRWSIKVPCVYFVDGSSYDRIAAWDDSITVEHVYKSWGWNIRQISATGEVLYKKGRKDEKDKSSEFKQSGTVFEKDRPPQQLLDVIAVIKDSYGISAIPFFEGADEFHDDRWMINVLCLESKVLEVPDIMMPVEWTSDVTADAAKGYWGRLIFRMTRACIAGHNAGFSKGIEASQKNTIEKFKQLIDIDPKYMRELHSFETN